MKETLSQCPACSSTDLKKERTVKDFSTSGESFDVQYCVQCSHRFTSPRPTESEIGPYYDNPDYISHTDDSASIFGKVYQILRNVNLGWKHGYVNKHSAGKQLLDYGCGTGSFLGYMNNKGYSCAGVEINEGARAKAGAYGEVHPSIDKITGTYDVITMWHVLEHVYDLQGLLGAFKNRLKDQGTLVVAVPNPESPDARIYGDYWAAWDIPIHVHHFSKSSMKRLMKENGFSLEKIYPMKLDSYYISLLSEQYKSGAKHKNALHWVKAVWNGFRSNVVAGRKNTSSLIYVFKKA